MEHSVAAYSSRLTKEKAEQLWQEWVIQEAVPPMITPDLVEILIQRCSELAAQEKTP